MAEPSSMLENAILDASALKEVAIKNAEATLLEKYSNKIKEAVDSLLEQDEEEDLGMGDEGGLGGGLDDLGGLGGEDGGEPGAVSDEVPLAATEGEKLCPCPAEEEEIEIDFGELEKQMFQEDGDEFDQCAIDYLRDERAIDWKLHPFFLGRKTNHPGSKRWYARLILPIYKDGKLVFFQGRDLTGTRQKKYLSPDIPRENVLYGYDHISKATDEPLYIVEGWFDAWHLEGVAVLGSRMTPHQVHWINQSRRPKVVIPDRFGDGHMLADQALELGWSVSTPDVGDCKDPNEAIVKYGKLYTLMTIRTHTYEGFEAALRIKFYCEEKNKNDSRRSPNVRKGPHQV